MDRTEQTVRTMLRAIEAPLYDLGVLSDRGMLPGLDAISAAHVIARIPLLKYRNARGSHIYSGPRESTATPSSTTSPRPRSQSSHRTASLRAPLSRPAPATFGPGSSTPPFSRNCSEPSRPRPSPPATARTQRGGLEALRTAPRLHQLQARYRNPDGLFPFVRLRSHSGQRETLHSPLF